MPSKILQFIQSDLIGLPKNLAGSSLGDFLRGLYTHFQLTIALDNAVGDQIRLKCVSISTLCESIIAAVDSMDLKGMDSAVALVTPGLEAVRADLLAVARQNEDGVLQGQSLYRIRDSKGSRLSKPVELFHLPFELCHVTSVIRPYC